MKVRSDFVTNSSSSSFILGFNSAEDIDKVRDELPSYWSDDAKDEVVSDIKEGSTTKEGALEEYKHSLYGYRFDWKFKGMDYWSLTKEERASKEYLSFVSQKEFELSQDFIKKLDEYEEFSIVSYEDHTDFGSTMEHDIMPCLGNTLKAISHH